FRARSPAPHSNRSRCAGCRTSRSGGRAFRRTCWQFLLRSVKAARHSEPASPLATPACCAKMRPMPFRPSRRVLVPPFIAMDVLREALEREAAGHSVIHLEVGQPGTPAPQAVLDAARRALTEERLGYTDALGIAPLREAIAGHYQDQYGVAVDPGDIIVTTGSSAAFQLAFLAAFEPADRGAPAAPGYP